MASTHSQISKWLLVVWSLRMLQLILLKSACECSHRIKNYLLSDEIWKGIK